MKKFSLQKELIAGALSATMFLTGCNNTVNNTINNTINNEMTIDNDANIGVDVDVNSIINKITNSQNEGLPLTTEIEQVELKDFKTGYKLPTNYVPYNLDNESKLPGMFGIALETSEYTVYELPTATDEYGQTVEVSLENSVGLYEPCAKILLLKKDILNKYGKDTQINTITDYSFATKEEQEVLKAVDILHDKVVDEYNASKGYSLKK